MIMISTEARNARFAKRLISLRGGKSRNWDWFLAVSTVLVMLGLVMLGAWLERNGVLS